jgi:hypothetical protein
LEHNLGAIGRSPTLGIHRRGKLSFYLSEAGSGLMVQIRTEQR